jgi:hypothetical protein
MASPNKYETCAEIEIVVARYFDPRRNTVVPNVWWGMGLDHECDLFVMTKAGYAYEVEIKTSKADLKADQLKRHGHKTKMIRKLYFAIPKKLEGCIDLIPERAGVLVVSAGGFIEKVREAIDFPGNPLSPQQQLKLARLGCMRIWTLKATIRSIRRERDEL